MAISAKVEGIERLREKLLALVNSSTARGSVRAANAKSADEMAALVRAIIPRGNDEEGHVADTLKRFQEGDWGEGVSIGDAAHRYPLHLEAGHRDKGGKHVPAKPYWYPSLRVLRKRSKGRVNRAYLAAVKQIAGPAAPTSG